MGRRGVLAVVAAVAVLAAGLGWVLGQRIKSPAEIAADTAPPEPSLVTVPVELRELSSRVVVRGTVQSSEATPISISGAADGSPVVTRMPKEVGDQLDEGEVAIEITGRPVILLQGRLPVYRSMGPSMEGPDVRQLEEALLRLGFDPGEVDGLYSSATAGAVDDLYRSVGYRPTGPTPSEQDALEGARDRVTQAQRALNQAGGSSSGGSVPESVRLQADQAVTEAERAVGDAKAAKEAGPADLKAAVTEAESALASAEQERDAAEARLAEAQGGSHPDTGEPPTEEDLAQLQEAVDQVAALVEAASETLKAAQDALDAGITSFDRAIADARTQLAIAKASRSETFAQYTDPPDSTGGLPLSDLRQDLADAQSDLAELQASTGVTVPAFDLVFVPTLPRQVQSVSVELGSAATGTVMTVTGASTELTSAVAASDRKLLSEGLDAVIEDDELGIRAEATVSFLADDPGGLDLPEDRYAMRLIPLEDLPEEAYNQSLRVTIPISSTGNEVLAVPLAAVSAGAGGESRVEVQNEDGSTRLVTVATGLSADGYVEVTPRGGELEEDDRVVVGRDLLLPGSDDSSGDSADDEDSDAAPLGGSSGFADSTGPFPST